MEMSDLNFKDMEVCHYKYLAEISIGVKFINCV